MLVGQAEELAHRLRAGFTHRLEQPFGHGAEQFLRLQVEGRLRQTWVAPVEQGGAQEVQPADRPVKQIPDNRLGEGILGEVVKEALDHGRGMLFARRENPSARGQVERLILPRRNVHPPRSV